MKIKAKTKLILNLPVEVIIPHEVDIDLLTEVLASSLRAQTLSVRGAYYDYKFRGDLMSEYDIKDNLAITGAE